MSEQPIQDHDLPAAVDELGSHSLRNGEVEYVRPQRILLVPSRVFLAIWSPTDPTLRNFRRIYNQRGILWLVLIAGMFGRREHSSEAVVKASARR